MHHDDLDKKYLGNNASRRVSVIFTDAQHDRNWYLLENNGGEFDWGTLSAKSQNLARRICEDMGMSKAMVLRYSQKVHLNLISLQDHDRPLMLTEKQVLESLNCSAIDALSEVEG